MGNGTAVEIIARLRLMYGVDTDSALCKETGINRQTLSGWKSRDSLDYALCVQLAVAKGYCLDWLLTGEGPMRRDGIGQTGNAERAGGNDANPREQAILALFRELSEADQREIQHAAQEKKRLSAIEDQLKELAAAVAALNRSA